MAECAADLKTIDNADTFSVSLATDKQTLTRRFIKLPTVGSATLE